MEVGESMSRCGWSVWCGIGRIDESHEEIRDLTKAEAIQIAFQKSNEWPRVLVIQHNAKHPRGITLGGIEYGRISGRIFDEVREI